MLNNPKDEWTIKRGHRSGDVLTLCFHRVKVLELIRSDSDYVVAKVELLGEAEGSGWTVMNPVTKQLDRLPVPPLMFRGQRYDGVGLEA